MARLPRLAVPGHLHRVLLRGNNGQPIFVSPDDYRTFLDLAAAAAAAHGVAVHAYALLGNHAHLLLTPAEVQSLPSTMQAIGRRYVRYFNDRHGRSGTLWEGRYRSAVLQAERYALPCMVLFDQLPIDVGLAAEPRLYDWTSHNHYIGARNDRWLQPPARVWTLGNTPFAREAKYAEVVQAGISAALKAELGDTAATGWALGDSAFIAALQSSSTRPVVKARPGRRPKSIISLTK